MVGLLGRTGLACSVAAVSFACAFGVGAPAASAWEYVTGPPKVEAEAWQPLPLPSGKPRIEGRALTLSVMTGYCGGEPPRRIDHVKVVERPTTGERPFKSAVISVFVLQPAPREVVGPVNPGEPIPACSGLGQRLVRRIKLERPVDGLFLYDGSFSPPRRAWPLVGT
jgi:hypothetical protein